MKRIHGFVALILCLAVVCSGCSIWLGGEYHSIIPYRDEGEKHNNESSVLGSYVDLCNALVELVGEGTQESILYITDVSDDQCAYFMKTAIDHVMKQTAIGAYAVKEITYDIGTNAGKQAVAVKVEYLHNRSEILRIKQTKDMDAVQELVRVALENHDTRLVVQVQEYRAKDLPQFVQNYVNENPQKCVETPVVSVATYPETGSERILEVAFLYQNNKDTLRNMKQVVSNIFKSAQYYVNNDAQNTEKYQQLYTFLMERNEYTYETSITPAYSLLRHGVGDCRAFALVYMAMCKQVGLDCQVVSGTKNGEPWTWNIVKEQDIYYHVDLLECNTQGEFAMKTEDTMAGYVWDYSAFQEPESE